MAKRWKESGGRYECELVVDPGLTPGGILEDNNRRSRRNAELARLASSLASSREGPDEVFARAKELLKAEAALAGEVDDIEGPVDGRMRVCVSDYSGSIGSRHTVFIWLKRARDGSTTADAGVEWLERSGEDRGGLENLHGVIRISDVECLSRMPTGQRQCVIEYELAGQKHYQGVVSEVTTKNRITLWL